MYDLLIRGGDAVLPGTDGVRADIAVSGGKIAGILAPGNGAGARETLDAGGLVVFPGVIDVHLHLGHGHDIAQPRVPEDAASETAAAAVGGVTTMIPYLMATEPFEVIFDDVRTVTEGGARIDFSYHFIISTEAQLAAVPRYVRDIGVTSFKIFMNNRGGEGKRLGLPDIDDGFLFRLCEAAAEHGGLVCPHPENIEVAWVLRDRLMAQDPDGLGGLAAWNASRPPFLEADAVQRVGLFARQTGARLYIVHTSSRLALEEGRRARANGTDITIETCPHYLTHSIGWSRGDVGKINPPLREPSDCAALWDGIADGTIDTVATDHIHRNLSSKDGGIWKASPGCPGIDTLLPVLLSEGHHRRKLSLGRIASVAAQAPAKAMGLSHRKGRIALGLDADFAIVDLQAEHTPQASNLKSSAGYSIYEGVPLRGRVRHTLVGGRFVLLNNELVADAVGTGRFIPRQAG
jgi:dihydroorotase-like cyclic amidohydrolase